MTVSILILIYPNITVILNFKMASSVEVILVESLRSQGVEYLFGIVGIPIVEVAYFAQVAGVKYIRNEKPASSKATPIKFIVSPYICGQDVGGL